MFSIRLLFASLALAAFPGAILAQDRPEILKNPLERYLPGGGDKKDDRRIDNADTAKKILASNKAGNGWAIAEVQSIDEKDGSIVRYRKVLETHTEGTNGKESVVVLTLGPPTPWVKLPGKGKEDGPLTEAVGACRARLEGLDKLIKVSTTAKEKADFLAQKKVVQETLDALLK